MMVDFFRSVRCLARSFRCLAVVVLPVVAIASAVVPASAQRMVSADELRQIQSVVPLVGPPGTEVRINSENLPLQAKVHVGVGSVGAGFETVGEAWQGEWGEVEATVRVPRSASWERPIFFIAFNAIFSPIGISEPFHVTNADGEVSRQGRVTDMASDCLIFLDRDELTYGVSGDLHLLDAGDEATIEGRYEERATCGQPRTIRLTRVVARRR